MSKSTGIRIAKALAVVFGLVVIAALGVYSLSSQRHIRIVAPGTALGRLPVVGPNALVEMVPGLTMKLDTGCDFSIITQDDLKRIKRMGLKVDSTYYPQLGRDRAGHISLRMRRYSVDIPVGVYDFATDSTGRWQHTFTDSVNLIRHVDFVPAEPDETSQIGIDLIERFILEYNTQPEALTFHTAMPADYKVVDEIYEIKSPTDLMTLGHRYYAKLKVERKTHPFFIDTGLKNVHLKMPSAACSASRRNLRSDTIVQRGTAVPVIIDSSAWAEYGNRAGNYIAFYYDSQFGGEEYAVNPIILFQQDAVIDFPGRQLALHPYVTLPKRHFSR